MQLHHDKVTVQIYGGKEMTDAERRLKIEMLTEENLIMLLVFLDQLTNLQDTHRIERDSQG